MLAGVSGQIMVYPCHGTLLGNVCFRGVTLNVERPSKRLHTYVHFCNIIEMANYRCGD